MVTWLNVQLTNCVYADFAGSCDAFRRLVRARGKDVLYIGDHIFGDVLRSKVKYLNSKVKG